MAAAAAPTDAAADRSAIVRRPLEALVDLPAAAANERVESVGRRRNTASSKVCWRRGATLPPRGSTTCIRADALVISTRS